MAFNILPGAGRVWKAQRSSVLIAGDVTMAMHNFEVRSLRSYLPTFYDFIMSRQGKEALHEIMVEANVPVSRPKDLYIFHT